MLDIVIMLRRRWWLIVSIIIVGCGSAYGYGRMQTPMYEASSRLIITSIGDETAKKPIDPQVIQANLLMLQTYKDIVRTPNVMKKVVKENPELGLSAGQISSKLSVSTSTTSQVLTIAARDEQYKRAAHIVNTVSAAFIDEAGRLYHSHNLEVLYSAEEQPEYTPQSVNIGKKMLLIVGFVLSAMCGVGICVLLQYFDQSIRTERDVTRAFGLSTLIEVPLLIDSDPHKRNRHDWLNFKLRGARESRDVPIQK
ncbi:YveK family protein [Paenibacillus cellulosilyticus]|uniref:YveK family protein n=1 Tax=Paenibacillus cellulosilyticus TaxID=375489 RepID=UPI0015801B3D|nr:Wzz/FepE/Etk N-terminal domain-containing protein [Paenibacillus cellulosilyticus]